MKKEEHIQKEVEKTLQALDGLERAQTDSFFFARLEARMKREEQESRTPGWGFSFAMAAVVLFIVVNITFVLQYRQQYQQELTREEYLDAFATEYEPEVVTFYDELYSEE